MELILWRHADAAPGEPDMERELTAKGKRQAGKMGKWLDRHLPHNCAILCSPAVRAVQTAQALGRKFICSDALQPTSAAEQVLAESKWPTGTRNVLVIGHQPVLGQVAALIIAGTRQDWTLRKGHILWIAQKKRDDHAHPYVRAVLGPELIGG